MCGVCGGHCDSDSLWLDPDVLGITPEEEDAFFARSAPGPSVRRSASVPGGSAYSRSPRRQGLTHPLISSRSPAGRGTSLALFTGGGPAPLPIPPALVEPPFYPEPPAPPPMPIPPALVERPFLQSPDALPPFGFGERDFL